MDAGIWIRVSTGQQDEQAQLPDIEAYCAAHGYDVATRYELNDKSAYHGQQESAQREALADMAAGRIGVLVVWASDRLERRGAEATLRIFRQFREAGGRVESVQEPFLNTDDPDLMLAITGWKDRQESARKAERVRIGRANVRAHGGFIGRPPFGYEVTGDVKYARQLIPTGEGRKYVPEIYRLVGDGQSLGQVAAWLTAMTGRAWWPRVVAGVVRNPAYRGSVQDAAGRTVYECEPLVGAMVWGKAVKSLAARPGRGRRPARVPSLLSGFATCVRCDGSPMYRIYVGTPEHRTAYYRCSGKGPARKGCGNMVPADALDELMDAAMSGLGRPVTTRQLIPGHNHEEAIEKLSYRLRDLVNLDLDEDAEDAERARLRAERKALMALPAVPDRWEETPTGESYGQLWARTDLDGRRVWLRSAGFTVQAGRPGMAAETEDEHPDEDLARTDVHESDRAVLVFTWTGDEDAGLARGLA